MKTIVTATLKGGVGKTMMAFNLAGVLAENKKVLLLDIDPQCNLTNNAGVDVTLLGGISCRNIFEAPIMEPKDIVVKQPIPDLPNIDIIPSSIYLVATELKISSKAARERILKNYIDDNMDFFGEYDYVIIDTNPSMNILNQNAFLAADSIILITDVDDNSRLGLHAFMYLWGEIRKDLRIENNVKALIVNKADVRTTLTDNLVEYCSDDDELSQILVKQTIRPTLAFTRAALARVPVCVYKNTKYTSMIKSATRELQEVVRILTERGVF